MFLDIRLPDGNGLDVLPKLKEKELSPEIIIMTGFGDASGTELAIKNGAWDYIQKPSSNKQIILAFTGQFNTGKGKGQKSRRMVLVLDGLIGGSQRMRTCFNLVAQAADTDANVLITGETGTGKELFALAIHNNSSRAKKNFVVVDCAALPDTLVESILFGHEKGTFTGADRARDGLIKQAHGGTLSFRYGRGHECRDAKKSIRAVLHYQGRRGQGSRVAYSAPYHQTASGGHKCGEYPRERHHS